MTAAEENKLSMYEALYDFGQDTAWTTLIASVPDVANGFVQIGYLLTPIIGPVGAAAKRDTHKARKEGATQDKTDRRKAIIDTLLPIAGPLSSLGSKLGDNEIVAVADVTETDLFKMRDGLLGSRARSIHTLATENAAALASGKNITATHLGALDTAILAWETKVQRPRQQAAAATGEAAAIKDGIKALDTFVKKQLDKDMLFFRTSAPSFYTAYLAARVIHDTSGKKKPAGPPAPPAP
jgi:hypothetical protein